MPLDCDLLPTQRLSDIFTGSRFSAVLPYMLNVSFIMDEDSLSANSVKEPGMYLSLAILKSEIVLCCFQWSVHGNFGHWYLFSVNASLKRCDRRFCNRNSNLTEQLYEPYAFIYNQVLHGISNRKEEKKYYILNEYLCYQFVMNWHSHVVITLPPKVMGGYVFTGIGVWTTSWCQFKSDCHQTLSSCPWPQGRGD